MKLTAYSAKPLSRHFEPAPAPQPKMTMAQMARLENKAANFQCSYKIGQSNKPPSPIVAQSIAELEKAGDTGLTAPEMATRLGIVDNTASGILKRMFDAGRVTRSKKTRPDGRGQIYCYKLAESE